MSSLARRVPRRHLVLAISLVVAMAVGGAAIAIAAASNAPKPPARALARALRAALSAPRVQGVTARIAFTNRLIASSSIQGAGPLLSGASGRLWASGDGHIRLELQSDLGDVEILSDGRTVSLYDATSRTIYKTSLPPATNAPKTRGTEPSLATIQGVLARMGADATISAAIPTNMAGREAYTVQVSPKHDGGLLGAIQLGWDAANGAPLRIAVYAAGDSTPVIELKATQIIFGAVARGVFSVSAPAGAKVIDLGSQTPAATGKKHPTQPQVTGAAAVQKALAFRLASPATLAGLPQQQVRLVALGGSKGAMVIYGKGLGAVAVLERPTSAKQGSGPSATGMTGSLPSVSIAGVTGHELATALGTMVTFDRAGVSYTVIGSVPPAAAEAAARGL